MSRRSTLVLQPFLLEGITLTDERSIGDGSYASVIPVNFRGLKCAGKKLHAIFFENATPQEKDHMIDRFQEECQLLSRLKHPNIVQFLGVHIEDGSDLPVLVMEFLQCTLSECVDRYGVLPEQVGLSILDDVATGLCYLHGYRPAIVHRDLSANNVLLSSDMRAKISDLGMAKILNLTPARMSQMTKCPGTLSYMPPEALRERPSYDVKLDCFSVGVMILHVLCGKWPYPSEPTRVDPNNRKKVIGVTEVERREEYLQVVRGNHQLVELIHGCLDNDPHQRPDVEKILCMLRQVISQSSPFGNKMELLHETQTLRNEKQDLSEQLQQSQRELTQACGRQQKIELTHLIDMEQVRCRVRELRTEVKGLRAVVKSKENVIQAKEIEKQQAIRTKEHAIHTKEVEKQQVIKAKDQAIQAKEMEKQQTIKIKELEIEKAIEMKELAIQAKEIEKQQALKALETEKQQAIELKEQAIRTKELEKLQTIQENNLDLESKQKVIESLKQEIASNDALFKEREATIEKAKDQVKTLQSYLSANQSLHPLHPKAILQWKRCANMPKTFELPQSTVVGGVVFVAGFDSHDVLSYERKSDQWSTLPPCPVKCFGLGQLSDKLVTVGGVMDVKDGGNQVTPDVYAYNNVTQQWEKLSHPMPIPCVWPTVVKYKSSIAVCGGIGGAGDRLVEVFDSETAQWYIVSPLPLVKTKSPFAGYMYMKYTVVHDTCYLRGGGGGAVAMAGKTFVGGGPIVPSRSVLCAPLPSLFKPPPNARSAQQQHSVWTVLPDMPLYMSALSNMGGALLALGGGLGNIMLSPSDAIHAYSPSAKAWQKIASLPQACCAATAELLECGEVMLIGGKDIKGKWSNAAYIGTLDIL